MMPIWYRKWTGLKQNIYEILKELNVSNCLKLRYV